MSLLEFPGLDNLTFPARCAWVAKCALTVMGEGQSYPAPMGNKERGDYYREFISCGFDPPMTQAGDPGPIFSSCALFVRAVWHWAGRTAKRRIRLGQPIFEYDSSGYLEGVNAANPAWRFVKFGERPELNIGDVFYRDYATGVFSRDGHVGFITDPDGSGRYSTAEGGGAPDGTTCRLSAVPKDIYAADSMHRRVTAVILAEQLAESEGL